MLFLLFLTKNFKKICSGSKKAKISKMFDRRSDPNTAFNRALGPGPRAQACPGPGPWAAGQGPRPLGWLRELALNRRRTMNRPCPPVKPQACPRACPPMPPRMPEGMPPPCPQACPRHAPGMRPGMVQASRYRLPRFIVSVPVTGAKTGAAYRLLWIVAAPAPGPRSPPARAPSLGRRAPLRL